MTRARGSTGPGVVAGVAIALAAGVAAADRAPSAPAPPVLRLEREPPPRHLRIRPRAAQVQRPAAAAAPAPRTPMPAAPSASATNLERIDGLEGLRDVLQPISFSINLGYQVDGARATGRPSLGGSDPPRSGYDYADLRSYGFGEAFVSTRGFLVPSLSTYFAARLQVAPRLAVAADEAPPPGRPTLAPPIATWFERSGPELRTGWAEVKDFLPRRWGLKHLRVRAGDQFIYGPWIVHMSGLNLAYEGPTVTVSAYGGQRRADYQRSLEDNQPAAGGAAFRVDLRGLTDKIPVAFSGEYLALTKSDASGQPASQSTQLQVDWRPRPDVVVLAQQRWLGGKLASQRVEVRTRYKDVTNLVFELARRLEDDWRWDPTLVKRVDRNEDGKDDVTEARRYLDLGPVVPQLLVSARAGTLIAENLDLSGRVAIAPRTDRSNPTEVSYAASYIELGGALEARLRRQLGLGVSVLSRNTDRLELPALIDVPGEAGGLFPESGLMGEESFLEAGTTLRMTLGARRFSALVELYGRRTHYTPAYVALESDPLLAVPTRDLRGGGRFTVDAWVGKRVRLFAAYDVSSRLETAPEISGYKSLRLVVSGVY